MEELTIEQALNNLQTLCDNYIGKKQDHVALEQSMNKIKDAIYPKPKEVESK